MTPMSVSVSSSFARKLKFSEYRTVYRSIPLVQTIPPAVFKATLLVILKVMCSVRATLIQKALF